MLDETKRDHVNFLCDDTHVYANASEAIADLTGEQFLKGSDVYGRPDLQTSFDAARKFTVMGLYLIRDQHSGVFRVYTRDDSFPDRNPDLYEVTMPITFPDGECSEETVGYMRTKKDAVSYARALNNSMPASP